MKENESALGLTVEDIVDENLKKLDETLQPLLQEPLAATMHDLWAVNEAQRASEVKLGGVAAEEDLKRLQGLQWSELTDSEKAKSTVTAADILTLVSGILNENGYEIRKVEND